MAEVLLGHPGVEGVRAGAVAGYSVISPKGFVQFLLKLLSIPVGGLVALLLDIVTDITLDVFSIIVLFHCFGVFGN